jgi:hypothetical protein
MSLTLTNSKAPGLIHTKGGNIFKVREVTDTGAELAVPDTAHDIGYLKETTFADKTPKETLFSENGKPATIEEGNREITVQGIMMQSGSANLTFANQARGNFYQGYKYNGIVKYGASAYHQEVFCGVGIITPEMELKFPGGEIPFEYSMVENTSAITIPTATVTGATGYGAYFQSSVTIPAGEIWVVKETLAS